MKNRKCTKVYSYFQVGYGDFGHKKSVQSVQKCTDFCIYFPVGYELFGNVIFSVHILASGSCVMILHESILGASRMSVASSETRGPPCH